MARNSPDLRPKGSLRPSAAHLRRALGADHNPLCRPIDRARSRLWLGARLSILLAVALACAAAFLTLREAEANARAAAAHVHKSQAVVLTPPEGTDPSPTGDGRITYQARVSWTTPAGQTATGEATVPANAQPGSTVAVWLNDSGTLAPGPRSAAGLQSDAIAVGIGTATGVSLTVIAVLGVRRVALDHRAAADWDREWAEVEPTWSGRARGTPDEPGV